MIETRTMFCKKYLIDGVDVNKEHHFLRCNTVSREGLNVFRDNKYFSDVVLDVFGTQIFAHKVKYRIVKTKTLTRRESMKSQSNPIALYRLDKINFLSPSFSIFLFSTFFSLNLVSEVF